MSKKIRLEKARKCNVGDLVTAVYDCLGPALTKDKQCSVTVIMDFPTNVFFRIIDDKEEERTCPYFDFVEYR